MISNPRSNVTSCSPNISQGSHQQSCGANSRITRDGVVRVDSSPSLIFESNDRHSTSLLYNLSALTEKFHQIQSLLLIPRQFESTSETLASLTTSVQEIIATASSMMLTCQQMAIDNAPISPLQPNTGQCQQMAIENASVSQPQPYRGQCQQMAIDNTSVYPPQPNTGREQGEATTQDISLDWYEESYNQDRSSYDVVELNVADLLAKYTHYCQICAKGFKRDANLRMHMRAHGDEYKSVAALSNKTNQIDKTSKEFVRIKYSCPHEGCKWNRKHAKFQPLKSMICAKNHYKRTHCPKMYVCKRCTRKQFSVLSDLRTHEKHCGDMKWKCSCGTTFSRKDKLMGHVSLFVGHAPVDNVAARNKILASSSYTN